MTCISNFADLRSIGFGNEIGSLIIVEWRLDFGVVLVILFRFCSEGWDLTRMYAGNGVLSHNEKLETYGRLILRG